MLKVALLAVLAAAAVSPALALKCKIYGSSTSIETPATTCTTTGKAAAKEANTGKCYIEQECPANGGGCWRLHSGTTFLNAGCELDKATPMCPIMKTAAKLAPGLEKTNAVCSSCAAELCNGAGVMHQARVSRNTKRRAEPCCSAVPQCLCRTSPVASLRHLPVGGPSFLSQPCSHAHAPFPLSPSLARPSQPRPSASSLALSARPSSSEQRARCARARCARTIRAPRAATTRGGPKRRAAARPTGLL